MNTENFGTREAEIDYIDSLIEEQEEVEAAIAAWLMGKPDPRIDVFKNYYLWLDLLEPCPIHTMPDEF